MLPVCGADRQPLSLALGVLSLALLVLLLQAVRHFSLIKAVGLLPGAALHSPPPVAAAALQPPDTLWAPHCQLPEDRAPGHGAKALVDISVICEFSARARRDAIRAGYGRYARELGMRVRFFVGEGLDERGAASRAAEALAFKDLVVLRMRDTYENLTVKSLGTAAYVSKCGNGDFFVKADDDVFVHPLLLRRRLEEVAPDKARQGLYIGSFWVDARPIRDSAHKNFEPSWKGEFYSPYAAGPFYILSRSACAFVGNNALTLNWRWRNEDMAMGTWMAEANAEFITDRHIKILDALRYEEPLIAEHYALQDEEVDTWLLRLADSLSESQTSPAPP